MKIKRLSLKKKQLQQLIKYRKNKLKKKNYFLHNKNIKKK